MKNPIDDLIKYRKFLESIPLKKYYFNKNGDGWFKRGFRARM